MVSILRHMQGKKFSIARDGAAAVLRKKVVIMGDGACGKTCLFMSFIREESFLDYIPTVFENYVKDVKADRTVYELALWDTAGQEDYDRLRPLSYPDSDVLLAAFSIDSPAAFENIPNKWIPEARHFCPNVPIVLVGLKKDLRNDESTIKQLKKDEQKPVSRRDAVEMAKKIDAYAYVECSAKDYNGVEDVFFTAVQAALDASHLKRSQCLIQ